MTTARIPPAGNSTEGPGNPWLSPEIATEHPKSSPRSTAPADLTKNQTSTDLNDNYIPPSQARIKPAPAGEGDVGVGSVSWLWSEHGRF